MDRKREMPLLKKKRHTVNVALSLLGIGLVIFYTICDTSCSFLRGYLLGIDLKYAGILLMAILIVLNLLKWNLLPFLILSAAAGSEIFLLGFQIRHDTYCPYCLAFGGLIVLQFILNFERRWLIPCLICAALGLAGFLLFFEGSLVPSFGVGMLLQEPAAGHL